MLVKGVIYIVIFAAAFYGATTYLHAPYFLCLVLGFVGIFAWRSLWTRKKK